MEESRTANVIKNAKVAAIVHVINIVLNFIARTIFIKILGKEYLGINGLFTNILTVLSFAELGIGNAIIYSMYKPVAENDTNKIKALMNFYQKAYFIIGITVAVIGVSVTLFLKFIIKEIPNIEENIKFIYILFLLNTVLSYFFTYKKSIISAYQKEYIINFYKMLFAVIQTITQIIILCCTKNFILYLIIQIISTFLNNLSLSKKADNMYKYIKEKNDNRLNKKEQKNIFINVRALALYKFGSVILNGTDNIIISSMIGVTTVGIYSNYTLIINAVTSIIGQILNVFTASVGNLNAIGEKKQQERVLYEIFFISVIIYGFCGGALFILINPFIKIWIGKDYILSIGTVISIILHFYVNGVQFAPYTYRNTMGLFDRGKYAPVIAALMNIVLSIFLGKYIGLMGIFFATSISRILTTTWVDPYLIYKYKIEGSVWKYFKKYILYIIVVIFDVTICYIVLNLIKDFGIVTLFMKLIIYTLITGGIYLACFYKTQECKNLINRVKVFAMRRKK